MLSFLTEAQRHFLLNGSHHAETNQESSGAEFVAIQNGSNWTDLLNVVDTKILNEGREDAAAPVLQVTWDQRDNVQWTNWMSVNCVHEEKKAPLKCFGSVVHLLSVTHTLFLLFHTETNSPDDRRADRRFTANTHTVCPTLSVQLNTLCMTFQESRSSAICVLSIIHSFFLNRHTHTHTRITV